jgi:hypothetical protein
MKRNFRIIMTVFVGLCIISITAANAGKIGKAVNSVLNPEHEGVAKIEATDGNLADLEKLLGYELNFILPRGQKMDYGIIKVKVRRDRFTAGAQRSQRLFFFDLTGSPIEDKINSEHPRPYTTAITKGGSLIRFPRNMKVEDVKIVTVFSGHTLRIIELI